MEPIDIEKLRVRKVSQPKASGGAGLPRHREGEKFLRGPIPWSWWARAAQLPGKALHVASAVWLIAFIKKTETVQLQGSVLQDLSVSRKATYQGLKALQRAGLITCDRRPGRRAFVTILDIGNLRNGNGKESGMRGAP